MSRLLVGTDGTDTSHRLVEYLENVLADGDVVCLVNSHPGGEETTSGERTEGEKALAVMDEALGDVVVERHQYVRGNEPVQDLLSAADEFDADEYVIGTRKRTPVGKVVFGSTAQNLLLEADRPVRCVPVVSG